jgi:PIN domain nuclease of toxin-antitoxin system
VNGPVLDASALLAFLRDEPGADLVGEALVAGANISAINWAEALGKLADQGQEPETVAQDLEDQGILGPALVVHEVDELLARRIAELRPLTRALGLSLGDRACLALGRRLGLTILTADRDWMDLDLGLDIRLIRNQRPTPPSPAPPRPPSGNTTSPSG